MRNVPDDWCQYYYTCSICGGRAHASGTDECYCTPCKDCGEYCDPDEEYCESCQQKIEDELMEEEEDEWDGTPIASW